MKSLVTRLVLILFVFTAFTVVAEAQLKENLPGSATLSGPIFEQQDNSSDNLFSNLFSNFNMSHSYSMTFSSFGGQFQNMNAYTNTMQFDLSDRMSGRVDLSLLHSPFGNNFMNTNNDLGAKFIIRNAELNYDLGENSRIQLQFQQNPYYGMSPWSASHRSPFATPNF